MVRHKRWTASRAALLITIVIAPLALPGCDVEEAVEEVKKKSDEILVEAQKLARQACLALDRALRESAIDPTRSVSIEAKAFDIAIKLVPFVGPAKRYANARRLYEVAASEGDGSRILRAKRQCLLAAAEEGLDLAVMGGSGPLSKVADAVVTIAKISTKASSITGIENLDVLGPVADRALAIPAVDRAVVMLLTVAIKDLVPAVEGVDSPTGAVPPALPSRTAVGAGDLPGRGR